MRAVLLAGILLAASAATGFAQDTLSVTGGEQTVELTREQIDAMPQEVIETTTAWTGGKTRFSGPLMQSVLQEAGFAGETVNAAAADGYSLDIPRERLTGDGAILATSLNGSALPADRAPYWIIFPYDSAPEMNDEDHQSWSVYQLKSLTVK